MTTPMTWPEHQQWEAAWWGTCANTFNEENKQILYASLMGLRDEGVNAEGCWPSYDLAGRNVIDLGGGPTSILLKCRNRGPECMVADPCEYPGWVRARYEAAGIGYSQTRGEDNETAGIYDEAWIYNVLQHTDDPAKIVANARWMAPVLRIFEWLDTPAAPGHPQTITADSLLEWIGPTTNDSIWQIRDLEGSHSCYGRVLAGWFA